MKKANIVLDDQSTGLTIIEKMDYDSIDLVFDVLHDVFHPDGVPDHEEPDPRFLALWAIFLHTVGWTEDEYWATFRSKPRHCRDCGSLMDNDGNHIHDDKPKDDQTPPENKPN